MIVNLAFVDDMLNPLVGDGDDDEMVDRFRAVDPNDEQQVRAIIKSIIKPEFESKNLEYRTKAKQTLASLVKNTL